MGDGISVGIRGPYGRRIKLPDPRTGKIWTLEDFEAHPALLVMFMSNDCPFVEHLKESIVKLANDYVKDGPEFMAEEARRFDYPFPYLYDESQDVARYFRVVCTPEFFLFVKQDGEFPSFELVYHGQFDDSRPDNDVPITGRDLSLAIDCVLNCQPIPFEQNPCVGCSIKWHTEAHEEKIATGSLNIQKHALTNANTDELREKVSKTNQM